MSNSITQNNIINTFSQARVWPVEEALKVIQRLDEINKTSKKTCAIFETGYGPSGLPHMGTVAEVVRTLMIKKAFDLLCQTDYKDRNYTSKLIAFVDDMDGFRKVPSNVPEQEMLAQNLNKPLTKVPDPFHECNSFGEYNSKRFAHLLNRLECSSQIEIYSATEQYKSGNFNAALLDTLKYHKEILDVMLATLREERQATYSPFLPISPVTGCVLQVAMKSYNIEKGTITFEAEDGKDYEIPVTNGHCKLQWKPDLGMRWHALGIDYELYGKDLISTAEIASKICKILGSNPPAGMHYEHFLSPEGGRVSKSKGNESLTLDHWYKYTPKGCLEHFLFQNPQRAKRMRLEDLPTYVEQFLQDLNTFVQETTQQTQDYNQYENPIFYIDNLHIYNNKIQTTDISYKLMLSLACATHMPTLDAFISFVKIDPSDTLGIEVASKAYLFYLDEVKSSLNLMPIPTEYHNWIEALSASLMECMNKNSEHNENNAEYASQLQSCFFEVGKAYAQATGSSLGNWFKMLYQALIGAEQGPKLGSFCIFYGTDNVIKALNNAIKS